MSKSIIYDLYYGKLSPWECAHPKRVDNTPITDQINGLKKYFKEHMPREDYIRFEEIENLFVEASAIEEVNLFEYGMSMEMLLMMEVFGFKERVLTEC